MQGCWRLAAGNVKHGEEENCANAVIEQRLAGKLRLDGFWNADAAKHFEHRDGISGRDERAEDEALNPGNADAGHDEHEPCNEKDRDHRAAQPRAETRSAFRCASCFKIEQERAGKEQQRQHAVQDHALEIDPCAQGRAPTGEFAEAAWLAAMSAPDATTVSSMVPTVMGSLSQRTLIMPKTAAMAKRTQRISRVVMSCSRDATALMVSDEKQRSELKSKAARMRKQRAAYGRAALPRPWRSR